MICVALNTIAVENRNSYDIFNKANKIVFQSFLTKKSNIRKVNLEKNQSLLGKYLSVISIDCL